MVIANIIMVSMKKFTYSALHSGKTNNECVYCRLLNNRKGVWLSWIKRVFNKNSKPRRQLVEIIFSTLFSSRIHTKFCERKLFSFRFLWYCTICEYYLFSKLGKFASSNIHRRLNGVGRITQHESYKITKPNQFCVKF